MYYIVARYRRGEERPPESGGEFPILLQNVGRHTEILPMVEQKVCFLGGVRRGRLLLTLGVELGRGNSR